MKGCRKRWKRSATPGVLEAEGRNTRRPNGSGGCRPAAARIRTPARQEHVAAEGAAAAEAAAGSVPAPAAPHEAAPSGSSPRQTAPASLREGLERRVSNFQEPGKRSSARLYPEGAASSQKRGRRPRFGPRRSATGTLHRPASQSVVGREGPRGAGGREGRWRAARGQGPAPQGQTPTAGWPRTSGTSPRSRARDDKRERRGNCSHCKPSALGESSKTGRRGRTRSSAPAGGSRHLRQRGRHRPRARRQPAAGTAPHRTRTAAGECDQRRRSPLALPRPPCFAFGPRSPRAWS